MEIFPFFERENDDRMALFVLSLLSLQQVSLRVNENLPLSLCLQMSMVELKKISNPIKVYLSFSDRLQNQNGCLYFYVP